jgi:L-aminopeptidase/D-esterase-like protein
VVNATGAIVDRAGRVVRGCFDPASGDRIHPTELIQDKVREFEQRHAASTKAAGAATPTPTENTTLTVLLTNARLGSHHLRQFGRQVHTSMARGIQPFQTGEDGDVLFTVSTNEVEIANADGFHLAMVASELAWDAILACYER